MSLLVDTLNDKTIYGFAAALCPIIVDHNNKNGIKILNVNLDSNIIAGITKFGTVIVDPAMIKRIEYVTIMKNNGYRKHTGTHNLLRVIFSKNPKDEEGNEINDLIISWEPLRKLGSISNVVTNKLECNIGMRISTGTQRFQRDILTNRHWLCHELKIKDKKDFFKKIILDGDLLTRSYVKNPSKYYTQDILEQKVEEFKGDNKYHLIKNSCTSICFKSIKNATRKNIRIHPKVPKWSEKPFTPLNIHRTAHYLITNHTILPSKSYKELKKTGLIGNSSIYKYPKIPYKDPKKLIF